MENEEVKINEKRIEEYKKSISNTIRCIKYDVKEKVKNTIENFLDINLKNHQITEEEYDILNEFLQEILQIHFEINEETTSKKDSNLNEKVEAIDSAKNFREEIKSLPILDIITIYKGEFRGTQPRTSKETKQQIEGVNTKKEGEER